MSLSRRELLRAAGAAGAAALLPGVFRPAAAGPPEDGVWLPGDFHCHTLYSHDVSPDPTDHTWGWSVGEQVRIAESRDLAFLAITDHDRVDALTDAEYASEALTLVPGYEHSLRGGHAGVFVPDAALLDDIVRAADGSKDFPGDTDLLAFLAAIHDRDGLTVLNHPFYGNPGTLAWGYGVEASRGFDAVEVWNIHWLARHDTIQFADSDNYLAVPWWEEEFVARRRVAAVGGSDNHWRSTTSVQGVGQPTTWVYARDPSPAAILEAVRRNRTFVAANPPSLGGPEVHIRAVESAPGGRTVMVGGIVRPDTPLEVAVDVVRGTGNRLRLIASGQVVAEEVVVAPASAHTFSLTLPRGGWVRAELLADYDVWMSALTSPIYAGGR